jgi:hypothetical protein
MQITTPARVISGVALLLILGAAFVYRMGRHDVRALADFAASYEQFDKRVSEETLNELRVASAMKISSLTKNDGSMMKVAREISDIAATEVGVVKASRVGQNDRNVATELATRLNDLQRERKAAYAHFQRLLADPPNSH